jgi:hypothetical protein
MKARRRRQQASIGEEKFCRQNVWQLLAIGLFGLTPLTTWATPPPVRTTQAQAAWQFLSAVLRADYAAAYARLAPEVRTAVSLIQFEQAARPMQVCGQQKGSEIELYKLGVRLGDRGSRLFYTFSFAADSLRKPPTVLLETTFRDTASREILSFSMLANAAAKKVNEPAQPARRASLAGKSPAAKPKAAVKKQQNKALR